MKVVLLLAIVIGFGGTLAGAHYAPWLAHVRLPSLTTVVANGGRAEQFLIHVPADRLAATDTAAGSVRLAADTAVMAVPAKLAAEPLLVEHFKVRDASGNVVGVAARHWSATGTAATTTWSVLIPSRGTLVLRAPGEAQGAVEAALAAGGAGAGKPWTGQIAVAMTPAATPGEIAAGTGEFAGLGGSYTETWNLAGVDDEGRLLGTVVLDTIMSRMP
jgi:hypothetical protein